jgi:hypothetical protein
VLELLLASFNSRVTDIAHMPMNKQYSSACESIATKRTCEPAPRLACRGGRNAFGFRCIALHMGLTDSGSLLVTLDFLSSGFIARKSAQWSFSSARLEYECNQTCTLRKPCSSRYG